MKKNYLHNTAKILVILVCVHILPLVSYAQWSLPVNLSPNAITAGLNESMGSCIGVSGDTVHVVYGDRSNTTHGAIYYTHSPDSGLTWSAPIAVTDTTDNAWNAAIAVNGSNIHVVWREIDTVNNHRSSHYIHSLDGGNTWGTAMMIDSVVADWPAVTVSGNNVYVANDIVTSAAPYNTEIFFLQSADNGFTWSAHRQITFAAGRSEDEAINAEGSHVFMSWNDNRSGAMQILFKHSADYGTTWDSDAVVIPANGYGTMVSVDGASVDVIAAGAPSGKYQILLALSPDTGATWATDVNLTNDTSTTHYYPDMVRDGNELHVTYVKAGTGGQYLHSVDGGATWSAPYSFGTSGITPFIAYTGCVLHVILPDSGHINYFRNPTGNGGGHCAVATGISSPDNYDADVIISPNPTEGEFAISSGQLAIKNISIYNLLGERVYSVIQSGVKAQTINTKLQQGIYFVKVSDGEKNVVKKLIIE